MADHRADDLPRDTKFFDKHADCDERERADPLNGQQESKKLPADETGVGTRQRRAPVISFWRDEGAGSFTLHIASVEFQVNWVKGVFPVQSYA